jgi:cellulose biosynthesis protein BcsQ
MRSLKFLTWLDIRRLIRKKTIYGSQLPEGVTAINCFSDALEISLTSFDSQPTAETALQDWFGEWYVGESKFIQLDLGNSVLPVEFSEEQLNTDNLNPIRPFWEEIAYINNSDPDEGIKSSKNLYLPEPFTTAPSLVTFYSFKGGVGRTTHLAAYIFALLDRAKELEKPITILVIDADLEAPGLTYWDRTAKQQPAVSFIDFLEAYHCSSLPTEETLDLFVKEVKKSPKYEGESIFYFLPACLSDEQLLDTPILPENLVRSPGNGWNFGNAIHQLGSVLEADYVLIDLRAGISEISSPLIFDPRVQRFFVTTATEQSVAGLSLVLEQVSRVAPSEEDVDSSNYFDPSVIISFLTKELKELPAFENALVKFNTAYAQATRSEDSTIYVKRLDIKETDFSQELLYINSWQEAQQKLAPTTIMRVAKEWAESQIEDRIQLTELDEGADPVLSGSLDEIRKFRNICKQYEFAESGSGEGLLITDMLKNLATNFRTSLPQIVSLGAKGSGKTFIYVQLSRLKYWDNFIKIALKEESESRIHIFPFLQSKTLQNPAREITESARREVAKALGESIYEFAQSNYEDRIQRSLEEDLTERQWTEFWINEIARSLGIMSEQKPLVSLQEINAYLKSKQIRIVYLFDGLEDIFKDAASNDRQKIALRTLIDLPNRLSEIRQANLGLIILLRRDFLRYAITQNVAQFESLYHPYDLSWNVDSFLKLVYWVCSQANVIGASEEKVDSLGREELVTELKKLWGEKLGSANEARTAGWIFAALTDFKGRLQARDIVRLLFNAADITIERAEEMQFDKWASDRLLPPKAIRGALDPCSARKVSEAAEEYPEFNTWVRKVENEYTEQQKRIPFTAEDLDLDRVTITMLEDMGVIYEDRAKDNTTSYYIPEIFRTGLKFTSVKGARPRVLVLKRKALGIEVL